MAKYIGQDHTYGVFEKQEIEVINPAETEYQLIYKVPSSMAIQVVIAGLLLEPNVDYTIGNSGMSIIFNTAPLVDFYIVFLGKELTVPVSLGLRPIHVSTVGDGIQTVFPVPTTYTLVPASVVVFNNGDQKRYANDWDIINGNEIEFVSAPSGNIDIYVFGIERTDTVTVDDGSITTNKLADRCVTPDKTLFLFEDYAADFTLQTFGSMGNNFVKATDLYEAEFIDFGGYIKLNAHFKVELTGTPDNKIRISLPLGKTIASTVNLAGSVNLSTATYMETGILKWGANDSLDIYRQLGTNYTIDTWDVEIKLEYKTNA
jgi:hypothetical protein